MGRPGEARGRARHSVRHREALAVRTVAAAAALLAFATSVAYATPSPPDVTAIVRVDCRVRSADPAPHRLIGYVFTPTGVLRVTHDFGNATNGSFATSHELAPLGGGVFAHLVARIAKPRFYAPHVYRDVSKDPRMSDRRLAARRSGTTAQIAIEEPVGAADQQFSSAAEIVVENAVDGLRDAAWAPVTGGFDPFGLCRTPRSSLGRVVP
jgi:hypothetical protein